MCEYLKVWTGSSAVYIGKLVTPKKPINDYDDDRAHIDDEAVKVIEY